MVEPTYLDVIEGHAEVRDVFKVRSGRVAGVYVTDGKASRASLVRIVRNSEPVHESRVDSLKHFKQNVSEMPAGSECGVGIDGFSAFNTGDIIEFYHKEKQ